MKISAKYEKLMEFIYDEYQRSDVARSYGVYASVLIDEFERYSGIDMGDARSRLDPFRLLYEKGWITLSPKRLVSFAKVKPTTRGIEHVEERHSTGQKVMKASGQVAEIIGRGLKGFLGR